MLDGQLAPKYAGQPVDITAVANGTNVAFAEKFARALEGNIHLLIDIDELAFASLRHIDPSIKAPFPLDLVVGKDGAVRERFHEEFSAKTTEAAIDAALAAP